MDIEKDINKKLFIVINAICINSSNELDGDVLLESGAYITEITVNHKNYTRKRWTKKMSTHTKTTDTSDTLYLGMQ